MYHLSQKTVKTKYSLYSILIKTTGWAYVYFFLKYQVIPYTNTMILGLRLCRYKYQYLNYRQCKYWFLLILSDNTWISNWCIYDGRYRNFQTWQQFLSFLYCGKTLQHFNTIRVDQGACDPLFFFRSRVPYSFPNLRITFVEKMVF